MKNLLFFLSVSLLFTASVLPSSGENNTTSAKALSNLSPPKSFTVKGYEIHSFLQWNKSLSADCIGYHIYLSTDSVNFSLRKTLKKTDTCYTDFVDDKGKNLKVYYKITEYDANANESESSGIVGANIHEMSDDELLTMVEEATFRYFWDFANPVSGLSREGSFHSPEICTTGGSGFGVMAILVGIERGFITREQGLQRMLKITGFLEKADRFHGAWPHWFNGNTGKVMPFSQYDDGGDLVETSFLIQGLLAVRQYFNDTINNADEKALYHQITKLWETVEWDWYRQNYQTVLYWHWSPNYAWKMNFPLHGYMETLITYILAIASPTHPVPAGLYKAGWAVNGYKNTRTFYGYQMDVGPNLGGPLFWEHYSFLGFDPRNKKDAYTNYFRNSKAICLIDWEYCKANPKKHVGYSDSCWGLTASFEKDGYSAHEPNNDNGTISPTAALSSFPYTPEQSMAALKHFYRVLGHQTWGNMGFVDAFDLKNNWNYGGYLAIDQGPIIDMIENYRTGLLWEKFMANPEIQPALDAIGFVPDTANTPVYIKPTAINDLKDVNGIFQLTIAPNPAKQDTQVNFILTEPMKATLELYNCEGKKVSMLCKNKYFQGGMNSVLLKTNTIADGLYVIKITSDSKTEHSKLLVIN